MTKENIKALIGSILCDCWRKPNPDQIAQYFHEGCCGFVNSHPITFDNIKHWALHVSD